MKRNMIVVPTKAIENKILLFRGHKVMLDSDLAILYGVETYNLNKAVKRNKNRFPDDFAFTLSPKDANDLIFQNGISRIGHGGRRKPIQVFTEQGVAMLSSVLRSPRAVKVNVEIMRAFVRLRQWLDSNADLARKLAELEKKYDNQFKVVFDAIRQLMVPSVKSRKITGFKQRGSGA